jgi:hypothetical protein
MPKGGARAGAGAPLGNRNRAKRREPANNAPADNAPAEPPPKFETGRDFALWCLNAAEAEVPMEVKVRAMQALVALEAKQVAPAASKAPSAEETAEQAMGGRYAPRRVRGFGVVDGDRA